MLTDTVARGGQKATARYQVLTRTVDRRTGEQTVFGTLAKGGSPAKLGNFAGERGPEIGQNPKSEGGSTDTVIDPYGAQSNDRDRGGASGSVSGGLREYPTGSCVQLKWHS